MLVHLTQVWILTQMCDGELLHINSANLCRTPAVDKVLLALSTQSPFSVRTGSQFTLTDSLVLQLWDLGPLTIYRYL